MAENMDAAPDHIDFSKEQWKQIQDDQKQYFDDQEIVGWFFSQPQITLEATELMTKVHMKYFGGEKVLMLMEPTEKEEAFFLLRKRTYDPAKRILHLLRKNPLMQEYMIEKTKDMGQGASETVGDEAVTTFRKIIKNKKTPETEEKTPEGDGAYLCFFLCGYSLSGACRPCCRRRLLQKLHAHCGAFCGFHCYGHV